jgi:hypothetical protein
MTEGITIVNFAHPLTESQREQVAALSGSQVAQVREVTVQLDVAQPLLPQVVAWVDQVSLSPTEWQTLPIVVNLPGLAVVTAALLAELHGRLGYFPTVIRIRPVAGSIPTRYEVAEILNLQSAREEARIRRLG